MKGEGKKLKDYFLEQLQIVPVKDPARYKARVVRMKQYTQLLIHERFQMKRSLLLSSTHSWVETMKCDDMSHYQRGFLACQSYIFSIVSPLLREWKKLPFVDYDLRNLPKNHLSFQSVRWLWVCLFCFHDDPTKCPPIPSSILNEDFFHHKENKFVIESILGGEESTQEESKEENDISTTTIQLQSQDSQFFDEMFDSSPSQMANQLFLKLESTMKECEKLYPPHHCKLDEREFVSHSTSISQMKKIIKRLFVGFENKKSSSILDDLPNLVEQLLNQRSRIDQIKLEKVDVQYQIEEIKRKRKEEQEELKRLKELEKLQISDEDEDEAAIKINSEAINEKEKDEEDEEDEIIFEEVEEYEPQFNLLLEELISSLQLIPSAVLLPTSTMFLIPSLSGLSIQQKTKDYKSCRPLHLFINWLAQKVFPSLMKGEFDISIFTHLSERQERLKCFLEDQETQVFRLVERVQQDLQNSEGFLEDEEEELKWLVEDYHDIEKDKRGKMFKETRRQLEKERRLKQREKRNIEK